MTEFARPEDAIDWAALRRRVDAAEQALRAGEQARADAEDVLRQRARALAATTEERSDQREHPLATVELGGERFAVETSRVLEVTHLDGWTPLPGAQPPLAGVAAWRGGLLTLYQIHEELGVGAAPGPGPAWVLVCGSPRVPFGLLIEAPGEFHSVPEAALTPPPPELGERARWFRWLTPGSVPVLDGDRLISLHR